MFWIKCSKASTPRPENNVQRARVRSCVLVTIRLLGPLLLLIRLLLRLIRICLKLMGMEAVLCWKAGACCTPIFVSLTQYGDSNPRREDLTQMQQILEHLAFQGLRERLR